MWEGKRAFLVSFSQDNVYTILSKLGPDTSRLLSSFSEKSVHIFTISKIKPLTESCTMVFVSEEIKKIRVHSSTPGFSNKHFVLKTTSWTRPSGNFSIVVKEN
jgi:hypothetical protein